MFLIFITYFHITRDLERWADGQLISTQKYYGKGEQQVYSTRTLSSIKE
jgi:hypothetical protein